MRRLLPDRLSNLRRNTKAASGQGCFTELPICWTPVIAARSWSTRTARRCRERILRAAVDAVRGGDSVVLSPAFDGGYTLIGLSKPHARLFEDIPWSTDAVYRLTLDRAREIGLPVVNVPGWYDVDDATSCACSNDELLGPICRASPTGAEAPATRRFLSRRTTSRRAGGLTI